MSENVISLSTGKPARPDEIEGEVPEEMREAFAAVLDAYKGQAERGEVASLIIAVMNPDGGASCYAFGDSLAEVIGLSTMLQQHTLKSLEEREP